MESQPTLVQRIRGRHRSRSAGAAQFKDLRTVQPRRVASRRGEAQR